MCLGRYLTRSEMESSGRDRKQKERHYNGIDRLVCRMYIASCKIHVNTIVTAAGLLKQNAAVIANAPKRLPRYSDVEKDDGILPMHEGTSVCWHRLMDTTDTCSDRCVDDFFSALHSTLIINSK